MNPAQRPTADGILFTKAYHLSMAHLTLRMGSHELLAQFDHFFRSTPCYHKHERGFFINASLERLLDRFPLPGEQSP